MRVALLATSALVAASAFPATAQDAAWLAAPATNDINIGTNWSTGAVPTGVATFDQSTQRSLTVGGALNFLSFGAFTFNAGAPAYTFTPGFNGITFTGLGIVNNSSNAPIFDVIGGLTFAGTSSAADANINLSAGGVLTFSGNSTAANATITSTASPIFFTGNGDGGNARLIAGAGSAFDFSGSAGVNNDNIVHAGSIEGEATGFFILGNQQLSVGSNHLSTEVMGVINDFGAGGSIETVGNGTLTLSNANTYTGGTTVTAGTLVANHQDGTGIAPGTGAIDALGTGAITLNGGTLRTGVTGYLARDITFNANKTSTLAAAAGTTLTIGGDPDLPGVPGSSTTGNQPARIFTGANAVAQFGSATETGTIQVGMSSTISPFDIDSTSSIVVAGGTLRDLQDQLWFLTGVAGSITVNAGATLDFNDSHSQIVNNLGGNGNVIIGSNAASLLQLSITPGTTQTFGGVISGAGGIIVAAVGGTGTMIFTGKNTYTGGTDVCDCTTLQLGNGGTTGAIVGDVVLGGTLAFNRSNTYSFDGVIADDPFAFAGGKVRQIGTGNTILTGVSTYTGNTTVDAGTLTVNGDIRTSNRVIVNSGGTLGGNGFVPDTQIKAGGTLAPGNSIGTLNVIGNLQFITGSTYAVEVSPTAADRVNASGTATLGGAAVTATYALGSYVNKQYTIVNATGGITGRFSSLTNTNLPTNFVAGLSYDTNNAYLDITLTFPPGSFGGLDQNQQNVANTLTNYFNTNGGIPLVFGLLTPGGLTQVSGEAGASVPAAGFTAMYQFVNAMMDNANGDGGQGGIAGFADAYAPRRKLSPQQSEAYAAVTPRDRLASTFTSRWNVWAAGFGGNGTVNGAAGSHNTSTRVYGTAVGADYRATPDTRFGFALGAAGTNFAVDSGLGGGRADVFQAGAYARHNIGAAYLAGGLAYGWQDVATDRIVTASGIDKLHAQMKAHALTARLEGGWRYAMPAIAVTPYGALQSTAFYLPSYSESATSGSNQFALSYASRTVTATRSELGIRFDKAMPLNAALLTLRGRAAWAHDWNADRGATATFQSLPGATFTVNGAQPSANAALISAGTELGWGHGWSVAANFDGEFSSNTRSYAGRGSLRRVW